MILNHDCVRLILLAVENQPHSKFRVRPEVLIEQKEFSDYDIYTIVYAIKKLAEIGFVKVIPCVLMNPETHERIDALSITELTWHGHEYLDTIRDNKIWKEVKKKTSSLSSVSLSIASELATSILKSHFNLQ